MILTVMPDFGSGPFLWIKRDVEERGMVGNCCSYNSACGLHPMSDALLVDFSAWVSEFERAPYNVDEGGTVTLDWEAFHDRGLALARRLKMEVGDSAQVIYMKPVEDPGNVIDQRREVLSSGLLQPVIAPLPKYRESRFELADQIISGGQTGVDRAALDFAIAHDYKHGGWCPKGRRAEDGIIPAHYQLTETESRGYRQRTRKNIEASDATLILNLGELSEGSLNTQLLAEKLVKPVRVVQLEAHDLDQQARETQDWVQGNKFHILNIAGPRESKRPGIWEQGLSFLSTLTFRREPIDHHGELISPEHAAALVRQQVGYTASLEWCQAPWPVIYGFNPEQEHLFSSAPVPCTRVGATDHFAVSKLTGVVRYCGKVGE